MDTKRKTSILLIEQLHYRFNYNRKILLYTPNSHISENDYISMVVCVCARTGCHLCVIMCLFKRRHAARVVITGAHAANSS